MSSKILSIHLEVLTELLRGKSFETIQKENIERFEELNYIESMIKGRNLTFDKNNKLISAYPLSLIPTKYKLNIEGLGEGYAMCAIDALGVAYTFNRKTVISTETHDTKQAIKITIDPAEQPTNHQLHFTYKSMVNIENPATEQCPSINIYKNKEDIPSMKNTEIWNFREALDYAKGRFSPKSLLKIHTD